MTQACSARTTGWTNKQQQGGTHLHHTYPKTAELPYHSTEKRNVHIYPKQLILATNSPPAYHFPGLKEHRNGVINGTFCYNILAIPHIFTANYTVNNLCKNGRLLATRTTVVNRKIRGTQQLQYNNLLLPISTTPVGNHYTRVFTQHAVANWLTVVFNGIRYITVSRKYFLTVYKVSIQLTFHTNAHIRS